MTSVLTEQALETPEPPAILPPAPDKTAANGLALIPGEPSLIPGDVAKSLVELFKLLADETRVRILSLLQQQQELNVRTLCSLLGQSQPAVSHHLALMRGAGLIAMRREGKHNFYRILPRRFEEVLGLIFELSVSGPNQIQFQDYVLTYSRMTHNL
ncbi:MAG: metalloregulator ArsR/SmtB family transcription factor [Planctomycetota bacterium]|nr:metalloregulator ArsR/SmtB family transcription factor [Planctomycetota bacterium]